MTFKLASDRPRQGGRLGLIHRLIGLVAARVALARILTRWGKYDAAEVRYRRLLSHHPGLLSALAGLGTVMMRQRRFEEALEVWREAIELSPETPELLFQYARAQHRLGRVDDAVAWYLRVAALDGAHDKALTALEELARRMMRSPATGRVQALSVARRLASESAAELPRALVRSIVRDVSRNAAGVVPEAPDVALADFESALALVPDLPEALRGAADCLERLGNVERALSMLDELVRVEPLATEPRLLRDRLRAQVEQPEKHQAEERESVLARASGLLLGRGQPLEALDAQERRAVLERAARLLGERENVEELDDDQRQALITRARNLVGGDDDDLTSDERATAVARARQLLGDASAPAADAIPQLDPAERSAMLDRARRLAALGNTPSAADAIAQLDPAGRLAMLGRARRLAAGEGAAAPTKAQENAEIERLMRSARDAQRAGRLQDAEASYRTVLERRPNHVNALAILSRLYIRERRFTDAIELLERLHAIQPSATEPTEMLARAHLQEDQLEPAARFYGQLSVLEPSNADVWLSLGRIHRRLENWASAREAWQRLLELAPDHVEAGLGVAQCYERAGSPEMAGAALQQVLARDPGNQTALTMLARLWTAEDPDGALALWQKVGALDPQALEPVLQCARIDLRQGRDGAAEAGFRRVLEREPGNIGVLISLVGVIGKRDVGEAIALAERWQTQQPDSAKPWLVLGRLRATAKQTDEALAAYGRALAVEPSNAEGLTGLAQLYRERGDYAKALEAWEKAAELLPDPSHAKLQIARIHFARQDPQVEDVLRSLLAADPDNAEAIRLMGYHFQRQRETFDDALEMWERLSTHDKYAVQALIERARLYENSGRDDLAEIEYLRALERDPRGRLPLSRAGNFYFGLNRFDDALKIYQVHREVEPQRTDVIVAMGVCLDRLDRFKEAEDLYGRTLEREPDNATVYAYRGRLLRARRQIDAAVADFRRVCALRPHSAEAWQELVFCLASAEQENEALEVLAHARETLGEGPEALVVLGRAAAAAQMDQTAVEYFHRAIAAAPTEASSHAELGLYYFRQGVVDGALHHLLDARELDPRDVKVARALFDTTSLLVELGHNPVSLRHGPRTVGEILAPEQLFEHVRKVAETAVVPYEPVPRKVVAISSTLAPGGAERQLVTMLTGLSEPRFNLDLLLFCISLAPRYRRDFFLPVLDGTDIDLVVLDMEMVNTYLAEPEVAPFAGIIRHFPPDFIAPIAFWLRQFRLRRPEVVHAWQDSTNLTAVVAALLAGVPRIVLCCRSVRPDNPWRRLRRFMQVGYKAVLDHPAVVLSNNSRAGADSYAEWLDVSAKSIEVVYNGIDFDRLAGSAKPEETSKARRDLRIPDGAPVLGGVFRMSEEKRPLLWLEVAVLVAKARPEAHFVICGDGPMRDKMIEYATEWGISDRVHLVGAQSNIGSWYKLMDVVMLTSRHEGLPNVLLEAQSLGIPVVAPDVGGMAEVVEQGVTGWTVRNADAPMLAERVLYCLSDLGWRQGAIRRAPGFIRERFGIENMLQRNLEVYGIQAAPGAASIRASAGSSLPVVTAKAS